MRGMSFPGPTQAPLLELLRQRPRTTGELADEFGVAPGRRSKQFRSYNRMTSALRRLRKRGAVARDGKYQPWRILEAA